MGVISGNSVVGFVTSVTDDYALVMSVLNKRAQISAKVKRKEILGSLKWGGGDPRYAQMLHIPLHYQPNVGDTVITSHYSTLYPEGMLLGFIERIEESDIHNGYYDIRVRLATDFRSLNFLYVVRDRNKAAIDKLQSNAR
jgi:rod shape-determining protein MreC